MNTAPWLWPVVSVAIGIILVVRLASRIAAVRRAHRDLQALQRAHGGSHGPIH